VFDQVYEVVLVGREHFAMRVGKRERSTEALVRRCAGTKAGFTFLELVIVVLILGIITMLALPAMNDFFRDETINAAVDAIVTAVYYARTLAITTRADHGVVFDAASNSFQVMRAVGTPPDETYVTVEHPVTKRDYAVSFDDGPIGKGVDLYSAQFGLNQYVRFNNLGTPLDVGFVLVEYGGKSRRIGVTATSCEISS
jgi:prepilin-type N-terminal cleavage/methylation domain-containing protein